MTASPASGAVPVTRAARLLGGLVLYGASMGLLYRAELGVMPWDVLHQGLAAHLPWSVGTVTVLVGAAVLVAWIPLGQRPGVGTVANVLVLGPVLDVTLAVVPPAGSWPVRWTLLGVGVLLNGVATVGYLSARLGPGPRDGLMTGLVARTGRPVGPVRTVIEVAVVAVGAVLGGTVGPGTLVYAGTIGPLVHTIPRLGHGLPRVRRRATGRESHRRVPVA